MHVPLHGIQLVPHSVGHMGTDTAVQQSDAISDFMLTFVLDLHSQFLQYQ
jgi:hypothetical protein